MKNSDITEYWIYTPIEFEYFLSNIFGQQIYHWFVWRKTFIKFKNTNIKLIKFLKNVIEININSDITHINNLNNLINKYWNKIKESKAFDDLNITNIKYLYKIIFEIIWKNPNNWNAKYQNRNKYLKKFRSINYSQNIIQKIEIIQEEISNYTKLTSEDIWSKRLDFWLNSEKFMEWFKENHSEVYCKLF
jgi:hypothetical protein